MATSRSISFSVLLLSVQAACSCSSPTSGTSTAAGTGGVSSGGTAGQSASSGGAAAGTTGGGASAGAGAAATGTGGSLVTGGSANTSGGSAGATTPTGGSGATGGTAASGGATVAGTGGIAATGGAGSPPGSGGSVVVTGGNGGTASGGSSSGGAKAGGATGSGGGKGSGGAGGSGADARAAAQVLDGLGLLKPCFSMPASCAGCTCDENSASLLNSGMAPENQHITKQFGGDAGVTYNVKLRVVGVSERYWYSGGALDPTSKVFYTGGLPTIHSTQAPNQNLRPGQGACKIHPPDTDKAPSNFPIPFTVPPEVAPADNCYNGFNIFGMTVSSPKQTYFFNYTADFDGADRQPHAVYKTDYTVTIPIAGQSTLDFYIIDGDHHQVANTTMTVPNLKNTEIKQPYSGNFLELQVVDVSLSN